MLEQLGDQHYIDPVQKIDATEDKNDFAFLF